MYNKSDKLLELSKKTLYIFDMDGTVYLGNTVFNDAIRFVEKITLDNTKKVLFFTNNASKNVEYYNDKIERMGFPANKITVLTSANVLLEYLAKYRADKSIYLLGTPLLHEMFTKAGVKLVENEPDIVVSSFDTTLTYDKLERACTYIRGGAEWLTTHPDINCPTENGYIPDCGAINALISASTNKPLPRSFGKPSPDVVDMLEEIYNLPRTDMVMFGDRLYTDVALGRDNGMLAVLMLTGEATYDDAWALPETKRPDLIFESFAENNFC